MLTTIYDFRKYYINTLYIFIGIFLKTFKFGKKKYYRLLAQVGNYACNCYYRDHCAHGSNARV